MKKKKFKYILINEYKKNIYQIEKFLYVFFFFVFILENTYKKKLYSVLSIGSKLTGLGFERHFRGLGA